MDISGALSVASSTLELVKGLKNLDHNLDKSTLKAQMAEHYNNLAEVKIALTDAKSALAAKDQQIRDLEEKLKSNEELIECDGFMYAKSRQRWPKGIPFCSACLTQDGTQIRPAEIDPGVFQCPKCDAVYMNLPNRHGGPVLK